MTNKKIASYLISILFIGGFALLLATNWDKGQNGKANNTAYSAGVLSAESKNFNFGTISMKDGNVSHRFEVVNNGKETIQILKAYTSCMCTTAFIKDASGNNYGPIGMPGHGGAPWADEVNILPGETAIIEAIFDPAAHGPAGVGYAQRTIYLETNSSKSPRLDLSFTATVSN